MKLWLTSSSWPSERQRWIDTDSVRERKGDMCLNKRGMVSLSLSVSAGNDVESLQLSGELRLHGVLGLMRLEDQ